ncbi:hypothetical protein HDV00_007888 [Rhizophlyctis rosea]|nr:hypothetical protein HDV00_007888 [Rhizophlyctis rosea]
MAAVDKRQRALEKKRRYERLLADWPVKLTATKSKGRHLVASKVLEAGTTVIQETAAGYALLKDYIDELCRTCLKPLPDVPTESNGTTTPFGPSATSQFKKQLACSNCRSQTFYCSNECREEDAERHSLECDVLKDLPGTAAANFVDYGLMRLVLAVLVRRAKDAQTESESPSLPLNKLRPPTPYACVKDLLSHKTSNKSSWLQAVQAAAEDLFSQLKPPLTTPTEEIITLACQINSNSHGMRDPTGNGNMDVAVGMFPLVAMLNHSCMPNCAYVGIAHGQMLVRTLRPVAEGEELTVSYVDLYAGREERRGKLLETKNFWCECERCVEDSERDREVDGVKCWHCRKGMFVAEDEGFKCNRAECEGCCTKEEYVAIQTTAEREFGAAMDFAKARDAAGARSAFEHFLKVHDGGNGEGDLHPRHHLLLNARATLINCCFRLSDFSAAASYSRTVAESMSSMMENWPETADFWFRSGEMEEIAARGALEGVIGETDATLDSAKAAFERSWRILRIVYGDDHPKTLNVKAEVDRIADLSN